MLYIYLRAFFQSGQPTSQGFDEGFRFKLASLALQAPGDFTVISSVQRFDPVTGILEIQGMGLFLEPGATLVGETGLPVAMEEITLGVGLRVEAELRGFGPPTIVSGGEIDPEDLFGGEIAEAGAEDVPLAINSVVFEPNNEALTDAVGVPTDAVVKVEFNRRISSRQFLPVETLALTGKSRKVYVVVSGFSSTDAGTFAVQVNINPRVEDGNLIIPLSLEDNTVYSIYMDHPDLEEPLTARFTTGASLPVRSITGSVRKPGIRDLSLPPNLSDNLLTDLDLVPNRQNALVFLLDRAFLDENPNLSPENVLANAGALVRWSTSDWSFEITAVPDGDYAILAFVDLALLRQDGSPPSANVQLLFRGIVRPEFARTDDPDALIGLEQDGIDPVVELLYPTAQPLEVVGDSFQGEGNNTNVPLETTVSVTFSDQPAHSGNRIDVDLQILPDPLSGQLHPGLLRRNSNTVSAKVRLRRNTTYQLIVFGARGQNVPPLREPYKSDFSTGGTLGSGVVSGRLIAPQDFDFDARVSRGFVGLVPANVDLKRLSPADLPLGSQFQVENILPGRFILVAVVDLTEVKDIGETLTKPTALTQVLEPVPDPEGPRLVMGFFDGNENGELDPDDAIEIADGDPPLEDLEIHMGFESIIKEAPRELTVTTTNPGDSETNVEVETSFSVTFSEPLAAGKRFVSVDMAFDPEPEKFDKKKIKVRDNGHTAFFPVVLAENQTYIWTIRDAVGASGAKLLNPVDVILSTGDTQEEPASVGGTVVLDDGSTPLGTVNLVDAEASGGATKAAEVGSKADIDPSGEYLVDNIPANSSFILFVEVDLGDVGVQQVFFDTDGDGPDIITLEEGEELTGIDFTIEVPDPPEPSEPGVEGPNLGVTLSPDANPEEGDQGLVTVAGLGTNARVDIAVYMKDLEDVWSYTINGRVRLRGRGLRRCGRSD